MQAPPVIVHTPKDDKKGATAPIGDPPATAVSSVRISVSQSPKTPKARSWHGGSAFRSGTPAEVATPFLSGDAVSPVPSPPDSDQMRSDEENIGQEESPLRYRTPLGSRKGLSALTKDAPEWMWWA